MTTTSSVRNIRAWGNSNNSSTESTKEDFNLIRPQEQQAKQAVISTDLTKTESMLTASPIVSLGSFSNQLSNNKNNTDNGTSILTSGIHYNRNKTYEPHQPTHPPAPSVLKFRNVTQHASPLSTTTNLRKSNTPTDGATCKGRTRIHVALLGLAIAAANCYAQATFCIAIVEMVLPPDYVVLKAEDDLLKVVVTPSLNDSANQIRNYKGVVDYSCPLEYEYRDFYDSWRFPNLNQTRIESKEINVTSSATLKATTIDMSNRFDWDASRQGLLLGAFAIGTAPLQVLGGRLAEIYGAKWVLLAGCIGTAITNLTIPFLAHFSFLLLILNRILMGIAQAGMEPGLMCLLAQWLTPAETGFFISMLLFAICVGFFLGSLCSSFLLTLGYGWPLTYYVAGGINLVVSLVWIIYASSRPSESRLISQEELKFIEQEQEFARNKQQKQQQQNLVLLEPIRAAEKNDLKEKNEQHANSEKNINENNIVVSCTKPHGYNFQLELGSKKQNISDTIIATQQYTKGLSAPTLISNDSEHYKHAIVSGDQVNHNEEQQVTCERIDQHRSRNSNNLSTPNQPTATSAILSSNCQAPWLNILRTRSVWAFIICKISIRWCADVLSIELPTYLANVLHLSIKLNGILNSVSSALFAIFSFLTGYLVNEILKSQQKQLLLLQDTNGTSCSFLETSYLSKLIFKISKTNVRKIFQSVASFGSAICVFLMTQYDCNILFSMSMLLILSCCLVMGTGGELQIPYDMTPTYPGTLHGLACTLSVSGWLAPPLIGLILGDQPSSRYRWSIVWYMTAFINLIGGLVFVMFADASPRDFDTHTTTSKGKQKQQQQAHKIQLELKQNRQENHNNNQHDSGIIRKKKRRRGPKLGQIEQERTSGRHLTSYYNFACKTADNSPPTPVRRQKSTTTTTTKLTTPQADSLCRRQPTGGLDSPDAFDEKGETEIQKQSSWCSHFDRDLIRIRQTKESFMRPSYLYDFDSVPSQSTIFPYCTKTESEQEKQQMQIESLKDGKIPNGPAANDHSFRSYCYGDSINNNNNKNQQHSELNEGMTRKTINRARKNNNSSNQLPVARVSSVGSSGRGLWKRLRRRKKFTFGGSDTSSRLGAAATTSKSGILCAEGLLAHQLAIQPAAGVAVVVDTTLNPSTTDEQSSSTTTIASLDMSNDDHHHRNKTLPVRTDVYVDSEGCAETGEQGRVWLLTEKTPTLAPHHNQPSEVLVASCQNDDDVDDDDDNKTASCRPLHGLFPSGTGSKPGAAQIEPQQQQQQQDSQQLASLVASSSSLSRRPASPIASLSPPSSSSLAASLFPMVTTTPTTTKTMTHL